LRKGNLRCEILFIAEGGAINREIHTRREKELLAMRKARKGVLKKTKRIAKEGRDKN
jgi:hypothetical protein